MTAMSAIEAYSARAREYADLLGSLETMAPQDRECIETWASEVEGPLLDLGCGPGHWTAHLASLGHDAHGADPVPAFVEIARRAHPEVPYGLGSFEELPHRVEGWGGLLVWYSLIHLEPRQVPAVLEDLHRALRPGGRLLLGFFDGPREESFEHAVATARFWPSARMEALLERAGFEIVGRRARHDPGARPHAALHARRPRATRHRA